MHFKASGAIALSLVILGAVGFPSPGRAQTRISIPGLSPHAQSLWLMCEKVTASTVKAKMAQSHITENEAIDGIRVGLENWSNFDAVQTRAYMRAAQGVDGSVMTDFFLCIGVARQAQISALADQASAGRSGATASAGAGVQSAAAAPPLAPASATPQPGFVRTLQLASAAASRTNCLQGGLEPVTEEKLHRRVEPYLDDSGIGTFSGTNKEIYVVTNTCSEIVMVYAASCMDIRMMSNYSGGDGNVPPYSAGAQAGVITALTGGSGDGAASTVPPGRKLIIASQGDFEGQWGRHPQRTSISQVALGAISLAAYKSGAAGDYGRWKSDVWNELNRVSGKGSTHYALGLTGMSFPYLWKGASCAATDLASPAH